MSRVRPWLAIVALCAAAPASAAAATTELVSVDVFGGFANGSSFVQDISADGRIVAFTSFASDLVPGDTNGATNPSAGLDVFVRDRSTGTTERVNVSSTGGQANGASLSADLSADGRVVAFPSAAANLVTGDTNDRQDVFVHERRSGATERVNVSSAGAQANSDSFSAVVSRDGRFVAFDSVASNLVAGDTNGRSDVYVRDRRTGVTTSVSAGGNGDSFSPSISDDGDQVAFTSFASNLAPGDANGNADVFVHDLRTGTTKQVSVSGAGAPANAASFDVSLTGDGRIAAFSSRATNLVPLDSNGEQDVFVRDERKGTTERVSVSTTGAQADGLSQIPALSPDGRFVVFDSFATNLVPGDSPLTPDLFLHERRTGATERVIPDVHVSGPAALSDKAREVAFATLAPNLVPGDTNGFSDVFVRVRPPEAPTGVP
jgi:Tol biopolymer transport system component